MERLGVGSLPVANGQCQTSRFSISATGLYFTTTTFCAGWLLTNGVDECALPIGELYVKKYGVTAQTLENCRRAIAANPGLTKRMTAGLTLAIENVVGDSVPPSISNGMVRLVLAQAEKNHLRYMSSDYLLCKYWQGYAASSNRYQNIETARDAQFDAHVDNSQRVLWRQDCEKALRELAKHQPLPLLPTNTINGEAR